MARQLLPAPTGVPLMPDVAHWAFTNMACGLAAGAFMNSFGSVGIKPTLAANARICEDYPRVAEEAKERSAGVHGPRL